MNQTPVTTEQFLSVFFPDKTEQICLRSLPPRGVDGRPKKRKVTRAGVANDEALNRALSALNEHYGMYFVVNSGGDCEAAITGGEEIKDGKVVVVHPPGRFNACFAEIDDLPMGEQHRLLDACPISPSIRVETRKSVHAYWPLAGDNPADQAEADWREVQRRLIAYFRSDPKIKDPSRVMRLVGFDHISAEGARKPVECVAFDPARRFTLAELLAAFPAVAEESRVFSRPSAGQFATWDALRAELGRRVMADEYATKNSLGRWDCRARCHDGKGRTGLFYDPGTNQTRCNKGCDQATILRVYGLPEKPENQQKADKPAQNGSHVRGAAALPVIAATQREAAPSVTVQELQPAAAKSSSPELIREVLFNGRITLELTPAMRGKAVLVARNCTGVLHRDELSLSKSVDRTKFVKELALPDDEQQTVHQALLTLGDRLDQARTALAGELGELDERLSGGLTISQQLIQIAETGAELFRDSSGECYASVLITNHRETYKLNSRDFNDWLAGYFFDSTGCAASDEKVKEAVRILRHKAKRAEVFDVHIRVAEHEGVIYLDLVNDTWQQVRVSEDGWQIIESADSPVRFRRAGGMLALPTPTRDGSLADLRALLNLDDKNKDEWALILGWLVGTFKPCNVTRFAYPLLAVHGEQGSAKSTACRFFRRLIDPNKADLRSTPKSEEDLAIAADHGRILAFDNLTYFSDSMSNALCRIATGGGFATRELFTNEGEIIFDSQRPVIINGIAEVVSKSDLLDRSLLIYLPRIPANKRKLDRKLDLDFAKAQPGVLGALLNAVSAGLVGLRNGVELAEPPRLADFAEWVVACEGGLGLDQGTFLDAYKRNQEKANGLAIEASPVAQAVTAMIEECKDWQGTPGALLKILNGRIVAAGENPKTKHSWPSSAKGLSAKLHELAPNLRRCGIEIAFGERTKQGYILTLKLEPAATTAKTSTPSTPSTPALEAKDLSGELGGEHCGELGESQPDLKFTEASDSVSGELGLPTANGQVHRQVHPVTVSEQKASVLGVLGVHPFAAAEIASKSFEDREVL